MQSSHCAGSWSAAILLGALALAPVGAGATDGFTPTGNMGGGLGGRFGAAAALLPDGRVLIAGGERDVNLASAELFDPSFGTFSPASNGFSVGRAFPQVAILGTGKILFANGGDSTDGGAASTAADLFNPGTGMFAATGSTHDARLNSTATLLDNGKVLVAGGILSNVETRLATAELYDPANGTFAYTGSMHAARDFQVAVRLGNGKVLVAGGGDGSGISLDGAELYDPANGTFTLTGSMVERRDDATATLLPSGKVLIVGGINNDICTGGSELYDPATGKFTASKSLITPRHFHTATLLPNGKVLVAGGVNSASSANTLKDAQLYDPATDTFSPAGLLNTARFLHTATLMQDGRVLLAGGYSDTLGTIATAEIYGPLPDAIFANGFES